MNRLEKKCIIVTAGVHLLLLLILIVGPAFFSPKPKDDDLQVLDVIPANLIDAPFNSGVANAQPPPPEPVVVPPPPVPVVRPPEPVAPKVEPPKPIVKDPEKTLAPPEKPKISTKLVTRTTPKPAPNAKAANDAARAQAVRKALQKLKNNLTSATTVDMPGNSSVSYANYASAVKSIYDQAWTSPDTIANEEENVVVRVVIANDGTVISANIITPSGDASVDASVQRTLERVKFIAPFPEGATEKERSYTINFSPKAKRMLE